MMNPQSAKKTSAGEGIRSSSDRRSSCLLPPQATLSSILFASDPKHYGRRRHLDSDIKELLRGNLMFQLAERHSDFRSLNTLAQQSKQEKGTMKAIHIYINKDGYVICSIEKATGYPDFCDGDLTGLDPEKVFNSALVKLREPEPCSECGKPKE